MNLLNEVAEEFPCAIPLAAGRPTDRFLPVTVVETLYDAQKTYERAVRGIIAGGAARSLQYGRTAGIINELVAQQLRTDENVPAEPDRVLITAGCQEALAFCLPVLCPDPTDTLLVLNPTYIGAAAAAWATRVSVFPILNSESDLISTIERAVGALRQSGRSARALYLIPTFDNPTGRVFDEPTRLAILDLCIRYRIIVLEDNPYGMFRYEGDPVLPLAALDHAGCVIYLSTFSKTIAPGVRVGAATIPEAMFGDRCATKELWRALLERKSCLALNTSQITQAMVGGLLLNHHGSLKQWIQPAVHWYQRSRDTMLAEMQAVFPRISEQVRWNSPSGGFFVKLSLPFIFDRDALIECATSYGVIVMPMSFFAFDDSQNQSIRLSFSAAEPERIRAGITSLSHYVERKIRTGPGASNSSASCGSSKLAQAFHS